MIVRGISRFLDPLSTAQVTVLLTAVAVAEGLFFALLLTYLSVGSIPGFVPYVTVATCIIVGAPMILYLTALANTLRESQRALAAAKTELALKLDELAAARAEAVEANCAKSAFLAQMSHELRTPLNAVIGFSEVIVRKDEIFDDGATVDVAGYAQHILDSGKHLLSLVNDILDLAKVEAGEFVLRPRKLKLCDVVSDAVTVTQAVANDRAQTIRFAHDPDGPLVEADERATLQIVMNLLSNAVKYSPEGSQIDVAIELSAAWASVHIADQGPGMTDEEVACALQPYARLDHDVARETGGTGLGLPIVSALIELHDGLLVFNRRPEGGTLVAASFPLPATAQEDMQTAA